MSRRFSPVRHKPFAGPIAQSPSRRHGRAALVFGWVASTASVVVAILGVACSSTPGQVVAHPPTDIAPPTAQSTQSDFVVQPRPTATIKPLNEAERASVELILQAFSGFQLTRDMIKAEYQTVADEITEAEHGQRVSVLTSEHIIDVLESVVRQQGDLVLEVQSIDRESFVVSLAISKLDFELTEEWAGYAGLLRMTRLARTQGHGERSEFRIEVGYYDALRRLRNGESYRSKVDVEVNKLLQRLIQTRQQSSDLS